MSAASSDAAQPASLRLWRQTPSAVRPPPETPHLLGSVGLALQTGSGTAPDLAGLCVALPSLAGTALALDCLQVAQPPQCGAHGRIQWRASGPWLFGWMTVPDTDHTLDPLARDVYADVFDCLTALGHPHLLRAWNYLPRINGTTHGLERYRQFNAGRQQAFFDANQAAFDGAPAACALGTASGPLAIAFLAARQAGVAIENPRQVSAYRYPTDYGPRSPTFSRAALLDAGAGATLLLISGTASIVGHATLHAGDVVAQTQEILRNLQAVLDAAHLRHPARFTLSDLQLTAYVRHATDADAVHAVLAQALGLHSPALQSLVMVQADVCRADLLVEIEAHACARCGKGAA